ncbi:MAG TPA: multidrug effflux MFS transporter [Rhodocyclaceae bacterium]|nr:multidrug effflux MFS transporter [Rhodocyclaceae bacterium]
MTDSKKRELHIILILGALSTVTPFAIDLYLPAFPQIAAGLGSTEAQVALSLSSYFVGMAIGQLFYGPLLDRFGRKKPLFLGLGIFVLASIGCALAPNVEALIALRFLQALGGCVAQVGALTMVRDFFPVHEGAKVMSLLLLILSVSPLLAPTIGSFLATAVGWQWIFAALGAITLAILGIASTWLPEGHVPDKSVSLRALPIARTFVGILRDPHFHVYAMAGAFCFSGLFLYVAGSPIIFMKVFNVSTHVYGAIFAGLSVGFIGGSQLNIVLSKKYGSAAVFKYAMLVQAAIAVLFLIGIWQDWFGLAATIAMFFAWLFCLGLIYPNAAVLALAPFSKHAGSASALLGFLQIGVGALSSSTVGLLNAQTALPIIATLTAATAIGTTIFFTGQHKLRHDDLSGGGNPAPAVPH